MKLFSLYGLLFILFFLFDNNLVAQNLVTENFKNQPLSEVFEVLSAKYKVKLAYDNQLVSSVIVTCKFKNEPIGQVLEKLLQSTHLEMIQINGVFIIRPKSVMNGNIVDEPAIKSIFGVIKDKQTGESLPYGAIKLKGVKQETISNPDGFFSLPVEGLDSLPMKISILGYKPLEVTINGNMQGSMAIFELEPIEMGSKDTLTSELTSEILDSGEKPGMFRWNSIRNSHFPTFSGSDMAATLQYLPGVNGTLESLSGLVIRHSSSDKNLFIYDGFTVYQIDHFFGAISTFNAKAIKDIRIIKGGFDASWGSRTSSIVEITGKSGNDKKLTGSAGIDPLCADIMVEGPIGKKLTFIVAGRRSFTDFYRSTLYLNLFDRARSDLSTYKRTPSLFKTAADQPNFYFYDLNVKFSFKPDERNVFSVSIFKTLDDLSYTNNQTKKVINENSDWGNKGSGLKWSRQWNSIFYHNLTVGFSKYHLLFNHNDTTYKVNQDIITQKSKINNELDDFNLNWEGLLKLGKVDELAFGLNSNKVKIGTSDEIVRTLNLVSQIDTVRINDNQSLTHTIWMQNTISSGALKAFTLGYRIGYHDLTQKYYFEPRFRMMIQPDEKFIIKFSAGKYYQFVNRIILAGVGDYRSAWVCSDGKNIPVVSSVHFIGGFLWKFWDGFSIDLEFYEKNTQNMSYVYTILKRTSGNKIRQEKINGLIDNKVKGLDMLLKKDLKMGQIWLSYSLSRSINTSKSINQGENYPALDDQLHELKLAGIYEWKHWSFSFVYLLASGRPWDKPTFTANLQFAQDYQKNDERLPVYQRVDAGLSYGIQVLGCKIDAGIKFFNLFNQSNTLAKPYQYSSTPIADYLQGKSIVEFSEVQGMHFTSSLYLNIMF